MVNPDLTILLQRWTGVKTWGGYVQDAFWRMHKMYVFNYSRVQNWGPVRDSGARSIEGVFL